MRHRGRGERGELGRRPRDPVPRPDDQGRSPTSTPRPSAARSTSTRTGVSMSTNDADRSPAPDAGRDLRHDAARRLAARGHLAHRRGQAADRRAARLARRRLHRGGLAGREPEGRRAVPAGADRAEARDEHARRVRLDPAGEGQGRHRRHAAPPRRGRTSARCASSASRGTTTCSRRSAPRSTRAWRWSPTRSSSCGARACEVLFDAEHFFDGYKRNPEFALRVLEGAATKRRVDRLVLCDTNGGALPHEVERIVARGRRATSAPTSRSACTCTTTPAPASRTRSPACAAARRRCRARSTATASAPATATSPTIIPNLTLKMGIETIPPDRLERLTPVAHHVAELVNMPLNPQAAYVGHSAFAHKAGLHMSAIAKRPDAYEHVAPDSVGNGTRFVVSELAGQVDARAEGQGARPRARRPAAQPRSSTR